MPLLRHLELSLVSNQSSLVYLPDLRDYHILRAVTQSTSSLYFDLFRYYHFCNKEKENSNIDRATKRPKPTDFFVKVFKPNKYHFIAAFEEYDELINTVGSEEMNRRVRIIYVTDIDVLDAVLNDMERRNPLNLCYRMFTRVPAFYQALLDSSFGIEELESIGVKGHERVMKNYTQTDVYSELDVIKLVDELSKTEGLKVYVTERLYKSMNELIKGNEYKYLNHANIIVHEEELQRLKEYYELVMVDSDDLNKCVRKCASLLNQFKNTTNRTTIDSVISYVGNRKAEGERYLIPKRTRTLVLFPEYIPVFTKELRIFLEKDLNNKLMKQISLESKYTKEWIEHELKYKEEILKTELKAPDEKNKKFNKENIYGIFKTKELKEILNVKKEVFQAVFINQSPLRIKTSSVNNKDLKRNNEVRNISFREVRSLLKTCVNEPVKIVNKNIKNRTVSYSVESFICFYTEGILFNEVPLNAVFSQTNTNPCLEETQSENIKELQSENIEECQISPSIIKITIKTKNKENKKLKEEFSLKISVDDIQKAIVLRNNKKEYKCNKKTINKEFLLILKLNKIPTVKNKGFFLSFEDTVCFIDSPDILIYCKEDMIFGLLRSGINIFLESLKGIDIKEGEVCSCKNIKEEHIKYFSNSEIIKYYTTKEFKLYYLLLCVISNNNNLFLYVFSKIEDINFKEEFLMFIITFLKTKNLKTIRNYKSILNTFSQLENPSYGEYHRSLTIYSDRIEYNITFDIITSRVLTMYDSDYFIKCTFEMPDNHFIYKRVLESFNTILLGGIRIRNRVYKVLAASANQIREKCLWFFSPYKRTITLEPHNSNTHVSNKQYSEVVSASQIINKLGYNFPDSIGTKIVRIGLNFSNVFSYKHVDYKLIKDIYRTRDNKEILISDGIGRISLALLISSLLSLALHRELNGYGYYNSNTVNNTTYNKKDVIRNKQTISLFENTRDIEVLICRVFKVNYIPCALQIRIGGFKGVVCLYPYKSQVDIPYLNEMVKVYNRALKDNKKEYINSLEVRSEAVDNEILALRESMKKYDSELKYLDIVGVSKSIKLCLNVQIIVLLEEMGGGKYVYSNFSNHFFKLLDNLKSTKINSGFLFGNLLGNLLDVDCTNLIKNNQENLNTNNQENLNTNEYLKFLKNLMQTQEKFKIPIFGRMLMGVLDEFDILESDEVFIQLSCICSLNNKTNKQICELNCKSVILGDTDCYLNKCNENIKDIKEVLVYRNPLHRFSDIQKVKCVNKKQLRHLNNVIVFSSKLLNKQTVFQNCSGGDLDGDYYSIIFDKEFIKEYSYKPILNTKIIFKNTNTKIEKLENFVVRNFQTNRLGILSTIYNKLQDKYYSEHPDVNFLIKKIEEEIDSFKKGPSTFTYKDLYNLSNITGITDILKKLDNSNDVIIDDYKVTEVLIEVNKILKQPKYEIPVNYKNIYSLYKEGEYRKVYNNKVNTKYYNSGKILNQINDTIHFLFNSYLINYFINKYDFMILFTFQRFLSLKVCKIFKIIKILENTKVENENCICSSLIEIYNENLTNITLKSIDEYFFSETSKKSKFELFNTENPFYILLNRINSQNKIEYQQKANIENLTFEWPKKSLKNLRIFLIDKIDSFCFKDFEFSQIDNFFFSNFYSSEDTEVIREFKDTLKNYLWKLRTDDIVGLFLYALVNGFKV